MSPAAGTVLIVEDDDDLRSALYATLTDQGFVVEEAATGAQAKASVERSVPDVVLLDLGLPDMSGLDLLADLTRDANLTVIVVSGRSGETDAVIGLDLGADDYVTKPFSERELVARVRAAVRRRRADTPPTITGGGLTIDMATRDVLVHDRPVDLTAKEFDLLAFLAQSPRRVYSRRQLLEHVWESSPTWQDDNTVAEHIHRVRRKLDPAARSKWIETVRGVGYRFAPPSD